MSIHSAIPMLQIVNASKPEQIFNSNLEHLRNKFRNRISKNSIFSTHSVDYSIAVQIGIWHVRKKSKQNTNNLERTNTERSRSFAKFMNLLVARQNHGIKINLYSFFFYIFANSCRWWWAHTCGHTAQHREHAYMPAVQIFH